MNRQNKAILFSCSLLAVAAITGLAGCAGNTPTSTPVATEESRMSGGFSFSVSVSNTHPRMGESIIINTELQNVYNTSVVLDNMGGETTIQITNAAGQVVWGITRARSGTTLTTPVTIGYQVGGDSTWTAATNPDYNVPVSAGIYTLSVSDTGFYNSGGNTQVPFSVTPIQITVGTELQSLRIRTPVSDTHIGELK